jgi:hypothetical protein
MYNIDKEEFTKNLLLTQVYCESKSRGENTASALRSFNPDYNGQPIFSYKFGTCWMTVWNIDPLSVNDKYLYDELFEKQLVYKSENVKELNQNIEYKGQILIAEIDMTVVDGASEAQSEGLIDDNDCPPIDTWFYKARTEKGRILFAWIPQQFIDLVDEAIAVNCVDCMKWYDSKSFSPTDYSQIEKLSQSRSKKGNIVAEFIKRLFR